MLDFAPPPEVQLPHADVHRTGSGPMLACRGGLGRRGRRVANHGATYDARSLAWPWAMAGVLPQRPWWHRHARG